MRVLVSTSFGQGTRGNDFHWTTDGELVSHLLGVANCSGEKADDRCGCARDFVGVDSLKGTTTCMVVEDPHITLGGLADAVYAHYVKGGWIAKDANEASKLSWKRHCRKIACETVDVAERFDVGDVLERRDEGVQKRGQVVLVEKGQDNGRQRIRDIGPERKTGRGRGAGSRDVKRAKARKA